MNLARETRSILDVAGIYKVSVSYWGVNHMSFGLSHSHLKFSMQSQITFTPKT